MIFRNPNIRSYHAAYVISGVVGTLWIDMQNKLSEIWMVVFSVEVEGESGDLRGGRKNTLGPPCGGWAWSIDHNHGAYERVIESKKHLERIYQSH